MKEIRTQYTGGRAWMTLGFLATDGSRIDLPLVVDTGCKSGVIVGVDHFDSLKHGRVPAIHNNFGPMRGGWLLLNMPELGLFRRVRGYESPGLAMAVVLDDPTFRGVVGLPVLQLGEFGGNATDFWFLYPAS